MSGEAPRTPERAATDAPAPRPPEKKPSRNAAMAVLLAATAAAVVVASLSTSSPSPRAAAPAAGATRVEEPALPSGGTRSTADLAQPSVTPRRRDPSPFDGPTTDSAVASCVAEVRAAVPNADSIEVQELFGDVDPTHGRPDSLIVEGRAGDNVWHCGSSRRQDGAVYQRRTTIERLWSDTPTSFVAVHAVTMAAEESCMRAVTKMYRGYAFRGVTHEQRGDMLVVTGDAFPLDNDLVRDFMCVAEIRGGHVASTQARKSR